jgi:hypothetical protein
MQANHNICLKFKHFKGINISLDDLMDEKCYYQNESHALFCFREVKCYWETPVEGLMTKDLLLSFEIVFRQNLRGSILCIKK